MKKYLTIIIALVVIWIVPRDAAIAQDDSQSLIGGDLGIYSKYVWRGLVFDENPVLQTDLWMEVHGISMVFWGNVDLQDDEDDFDGRFNEWDVYITFPIKNFGPASVGGEIDYLSFPSSSWQNGFGTSEISTWIRADIFGSPTVQVFWDIWQYHGIYANLNISQMQSVGPGDIDVSAGIGWGNEKHNVQSGVPQAGGLLHLQADAAYTFEVHKLIELTLGLHFTTILQQDIRDAYDAADIAATSLFFSLNAAVTFTP